MLHLHFLQFDAVILKSQSKLFLFDRKCVFPMQSSHCGEVASKEIWSFCKSILKSRTRIVTEKLCGHVEIHGNALSIFVYCALWLRLCIFVLDLSYSKRAFDIWYMHTGGSFLMDCPLFACCNHTFASFPSEGQNHGRNKPLQEKGKHFTFCAILQVADNTLMCLHRERRNCSSKLELSLLTGTLFSIGYYCTKVGCPQLRWLNTKTINVDLRAFNFDPWHGHVCSWTWQATRSEGGDTDWGLSG